MPASSEWQVRSNWHPIQFHGHLTIPTNQDSLAFWHQWAGLVSQKLWAGLNYNSSILFHRMSINNHSFSETGQRRTLSQVLICCSSHWRQYLTALPGFFSSPPGSMLLMKDNFLAPRLSLVTTQPFWFYWSLTAFLTKTQNSTLPKTGWVCICKLYFFDHFIF